MNAGASIGSGRRGRLSRAASDGIDDADDEGVDDRRSVLGLADAQADEVLVPGISEGGEGLRQVEREARDGGEHRAERGAAREGRREHGEQDGDDPPTRASRRCASMPAARAATPIARGSAPEANDPKTTAQSAPTRAKSGGDCRWRSTGPQGHDDARHECDVSRRPAGYRESTHVQSGGVREGEVGDVMTCSLSRAPAPGATAGARTWPHEARGPVELHVARVESLPRAETRVRRAGTRRRLRRRRAGTGPSRDLS